MNVDEIKTHLKRFISNPNTLTFLLVIALIVVVYFIYNGMVNRAISPATIPYSTQVIKEKTKIINDMIGSVRISGTFITSSGEGLLQSRGQIIDKWVAEGYQIPIHSFFYNDAITNVSPSEANDFSDIPDDYTIYRLPVTFHSTYGCSIMPGNYIDIYFKAVDDTNKIIYEQFIKSIQVLKVVDKEGYNVFTSTEDDDTPKPAYLLFAVPLEYFELLQTANLIKSNNIELVPVPRNAGYSENPEPTSIANEAIEQFILSKSVYIAN